MEVRIRDGEVGHWWENGPADDFDQTPTFDPTEPEPVPELDLDQTPGA